jgi:hypothetical protein
MSFNRIEIAKRSIAAATEVDIVKKDGLETRTAIVGKHTITAQKDTKSGKIISVSLDGTEAIGTPNPLNDKLGAEVFDLIETKKKELDREKKKSSPEKGKGNKKSLLTNAKMKLLTKKKPRVPFIHRENDGR